MKKPFLILLSVLWILTSLACTGTTTTATALTATTTVTTTLPTTVTTVTTTVVTTTTTTILDAVAVPTGLSVTANILEFDAVANAQRYQISIRALGAETSREYFVTAGFNLAMLLDYGIYLLRIRTVAVPGYRDSEWSEEITIDLFDPDTTNLLEAEDMNDYRYVKWLGRTRYDEGSDCRYLYYTASGFEVGFYGTELTAVLKATNYDNIYKRPFIVILIDGEENPLAGRAVSLKAAETTLALVTGLDEGYHTVKVLKRSEALESDVALKSLSTDGRFSAPDETKALKIQFIGDSSLTGYGNLATSVTTTKSTTNSDGLLDFAYLTSYMLDAEFSIVASSGWGISRGWNTPGGAIDEIENIPNAFDYVAIDGTNHVRTDWGKWDQSDFDPDVIVITLGTNDFNAPAYDNMNETDKAALRERFVADYVAFLVRLNNLFPGVPIIVAYGIMADAWRIGSSELAAVAQANAAIGETAVYALEMPAGGTLGQVFGSDYHPSAGTHVLAANALTNLIVALTGALKVRDNVDL